MSSPLPGRGRRVPRTSWVLLSIVTKLGALNGLYVLLVPISGQTELTGRTWEQFAVRDPEVASLYAMDTGSRAAFAYLSLCLATAGFSLL